MEPLHSLAAVVSTVARRADDIVSEGAALLQDVDPIADRRLSIQTHWNPDQARKLVREELVDLVCDAQHTQNEIKAFALLLAKGARVSARDCPFLSKVWYGDMYGPAGKEGLCRLRDDLNKQYETLGKHKLLARIAENV